MDSIAVEIIGLILGHVASAGRSKLLPLSTVSRKISSVAVKVLWAEFPVKLCHLMELVSLQDLDSVTGDSWRKYRNYASFVKTLRIGTAFLECEPYGYQPPVQFELSEAQLSALMTGGSSSMRECFPHLQNFSFLPERFEVMRNGTVLGLDNIPLSFYHELPSFPVLSHLGLSFDGDVACIDPLPSAIAFPPSLIHLRLEGSPTQLLDCVSRCSSPIGIRTISVTLSCGDEVYSDLLSSLVELCGSGLQVFDIGLVIYWEEWDPEEEGEDWEDISSHLKALGGGLRELVLRPPCPLSFDTVDETIESWQIPDTFGVNLTILKIGSYQFYNDENQDVAVDIFFLACLALHLPVLEELEVPFSYENGVLPTKVPSAQNTHLRRLGDACGKIGKKACTLFWWEREREIGQKL
ncbi:hypothetical protein H0H93_014030 [Arthromyces matolae]|nr:hypothetical protein H0H93_014030 [Arthromyces matolae]